MACTRFLLSCVNSTVSLVGFDLEIGQAFWYCPANVLRACGACYAAGALWVASDATLTRLDGTGCTSLNLPGPHKNYAHSVKQVGDGLLGIADTGNSRLLICDGERFPLALSPVEAWGEIPEDAIHLNDFLPFEDGFLVSAFSHQPFTQWKQADYAWKTSGWGCIYHLHRHGRRTAARIVAMGIDCPHTLVRHGDQLYCCSSADGDFLSFAREGKVFHEQSRLHVTSSHFLRGALRIEDGWLLGGSSQRHLQDGGGMMLYLCRDDGTVTEFTVGGPGEIYDILPWDDMLTEISQYLLTAQELASAEGTFPVRCALPEAYRSR